MRASFSFDNDPAGPGAFASVKSLLDENLTCRRARSADASGRQLNTWLTSEMLDNAAADHAQRGNDQCSAAVVVQHQSQAPRRSAPPPGLRPGITPRSH